MPILGIDYEKCNNCDDCMQCKYIKRDAEQNKVIFDDPQNLCDSCGRCISRCRVDAILYEDFEEMPTFEGVQVPSTLISYEMLHKFMISKRSIRGYESKKIPRNIMEKVLKTMKYAATGANIRTLRCTIISDEKKIKKLSGAVMDTLISANTPGYSEALKRAKEMGSDRIFYNAPHVVIIHSNNPNDSTNAIIAITSAMLSAQSLGLGSCWIGLARGVLSSSKDIRENIAGVKGKIWGVFIIGYPAQKYYRIPARPDIKTKGLDELE